MVWFMARRLERPSRGGGVPCRVVAGWLKEGWRGRSPQFGMGAVGEGAFRRSRGRAHREPILPIRAAPRVLQRASGRAAQSSGVGPGRRRPWGAEHCRLILTPRGGVGSDVESRPPDKPPAERDSANARPSGATDRSGNWQQAAAVGKAPNAPQPTAGAIGAAHGRASPAQRAGPTLRPPL